MPSYEHFDESVLVLMKEHHRSLLKYISPSLNCYTIDTTEKTKNIKWNQIGKITVKKKFCSKYKIEQIETENETETETEQFKNTKSQLLIVISVWNIKFQDLAAKKKIGNLKTRGHIYNHLFYV
jgi:hypothetical protein